MADFFNKARCPVCSWKMPFMYSKESTAGKPFNCPECSTTLKLVTLFSKYYKLILGMLPIWLVFFLFGGLSHGMKLGSLLVIALLAIIDEGSRKLLQPDTEMNSFNGDD